MSVFFLVVSCGQETQTQAVQEDEEVVDTLSELDEMEPELELESFQEAAPQDEALADELRQEIEQLQQSIAEFEQEHGELAAQYDETSELLMENEARLQDKQLEVDTLEASGAF